MIRVLSSELLHVILVHPAAALVLESKTAYCSRMYPHRYIAPHNDVFWHLTEVQQFTATTFKGTVPCSSTTIYCRVVWLLKGEKLFVPIKIPKVRILTAAYHIFSQWYNDMLQHSTSPHRGAAAHLYWTFACTN